MLIVVSPAKTLDYESELPALKTTQPRLLDDSEALIARARQLSPADISSLMGVSDKIAHLNAERFSLWERPFNKKNARPAAFAFKGDGYTGLDNEGAAAFSNVIWTLRCASTARSNASLPSRNGHKA
jgi:cytoplasmic iron level regulating protein YaaA (DUF328/UPF0246 family)